MGIVEDIQKAIEASINTLLPLYKMAKFSYEFDKNNRKSSTKIYAVRPLSGSTISGSTLAASFSHEFEVLFSDVFTPKNDSDSEIREKIFQLNESIQILYKEIYQKRLGLASTKVLLVSLVGISGPEIDQENNSVTVTATFTINYRVNI